MKVLKTFMESQLEDYNMTPGMVPMNPVLFQDAIEHSKPLITPTLQPEMQIVQNVCAACVTCSRSGSIPSSQ